MAELQFKPPVVRTRKNAPLPQPVVNDFEDDTVNLIDAPVSEFKPPKVRTSLTAARPNTRELLLQKPKEAMEIQPSLQAKLGTTDDLSEQARIFTQNKFPNMPLNEAMSRISRQGNRLVYLDTDGQAKYATPELFRSPIASGDIIYFFYIL